MKIAILFFLTLFFMTNSFADDGVKDPWGFIGCMSEKGLSVYRHPKDKKIYKKISCKDAVWWKSNVNINPGENVQILVYAFEEQREKDFKWLKIKLTKSGEYFWVTNPPNYGRTELLNEGYLNNEAEMSEKWDGKIYPNPDFKNPKVIQKYGKNAIYKELKTVNGRLWVRVELIEEECFPPEERPVLARGWIPFMHSNTESNFYEKQDCTP